MLTKKEEKELIEKKNNFARKEQANLEPLFEVGSRVEFNTVFYYHTLYCVSGIGIMRKFETKHEFRIEIESLFDSPEKDLTIERNILTVGEIICIPKSHSHQCNWNCCIARIL